MERDEIVSLIRKHQEACEVLHRYCEDPNNPLNGPVFSKLVDDMFTAQDIFNNALNDALKKYRKT